MPAQPQRQYTLEDYRRLEEISPVRHEFFAGEMFAIAGGTVAHNRICTRNYDRGDKFEFYKTIPTFREYLLIEQKRVSVERYHRAGDLWQSCSYEGTDQAVILDSVPVELSLAAAYRKVFS